MTSLVSSTRDFFELVKAIGESKSKQEEDRIIADEVSRFILRNCRLLFQPFSHAFNNFFRLLT